MTRVEQDVSPPDRVVQCTAGGRVALDEPLFLLWQLARAHPKEEALRLWSERTGQAAGTGRVVFEVLARAGLLGPCGEVSSPPPPVLEGEHPLVSVILLNRDGRHYLEDCLPSLQAQTYPNLEILVVDNGSQDDSLTWLAQEWPAVRVVALDEDAGFAGANNRGAEFARGEHFLFLNNDTRLDPWAIERMVQRMEGEQKVAAVVPMIRLMAQPAFVNALGNTFGAQSWGSDGYIGHLDVGQMVTVRRVPSACFAAVLVPRTAYEAVGPLDEAYGYYYEDLDWSWRARMAGFHILAEPEALVYHAFGGTTGRSPWPRKLKLVARNRLRFVLKNLSGRQARRFAWRYLREDVDNWYHNRRRGERDTAGAYTAAWRELLGMLPDVLRQRRALQAGRLVSDDRLFQEMDQIPPPRLQGDAPALELNHVLRDYGPHLVETDAHPTPILHTTSRPRVLIVSPDVVKKRMAGPGIRYWELAHVLARHVDVTLAVPESSDLRPEKISLQFYQPEAPECIYRLAADADVILGACDLLVRFPNLAHTGKALVIDLYGPFPLENLELHRAHPMFERQQVHHSDLGALNFHMEHGDFFLCASERQRDLWLGALLANDRVNPLTYERDESLRQLIDIVPFGIPGEPPRATQPTVKGVIPGIGRGDKVILWGGGIWNWLDPLTPIRAMEHVVQVEPRARLLFMGGRHPNPIVPEMRMAARAEELAEELGLLNHAVFFNHSWVAYEDRVGYLLETDVAVSAHQQHVETRFSFRTRLLDCLWSGLPMVVTEGDVMAEVVEANELGITVAPQDAQGMAEGLLAMLALPGGKESLASRFEAVRKQYTWEQAAQPLVRFCLRPHLAIDRAVRLSKENAGAIPSPSPTPFLRLPARALSLLRQEGAGGLVAEVRRYLIWRLSG